MQFFKKYKRNLCFDHNLNNQNQLNYDKNMNLFLCNTIQLFDIINQSKSCTNLFIEKIKYNFFFL